MTLKFDPRSRGVEDPRERLAGFSGAGRPAAARPIFDRLPGFYRENAGLLDPLAAVAEDLLGDLRQSLRQAMGRPAPWPAAGGLLGLGPLPGGGNAAPAGTLEGLLRWLEERFGSRPAAVWTGLEARHHAAGVLEFQRRSAPAAVLAWSVEELAAPPPGFEVAADLLPPGARVQAALIERSVRGRPPLAGERIAGEVFWSSLAIGPGMGLEGPA